MKPAYYNEIDEYCAEWLRNLIIAGLIPPGEVDTRRIEDVRPDDLRGFGQCHFFAGLGGWPYALRCVGWPDDDPVWSGSCPCQPFSEAGDGLGFADERHLWPYFYHLIIQRRPKRIYGEQVAKKLAAAWIDLVQDDMEGMGYAFGAVPFPACSVGAPNIRERLYWMADALDERRQGHADGAESLGRNVSAGCGEIGGMADARRERFKRRQGFPERRIDDRTVAERLKGHYGFIGIDETSVSRSDAPGPLNGFWRDADWLACTDGKWRPVEPGTSPLASGVPARVDKLRAFGNAINARQAIEFIKATL